MLFVPVGSPLESLHLKRKMNQSVIEITVTRNRIKRFSCSWLAAGVQQPWLIAVVIVSEYAINGRSDATLHLSGYYKRPNQMAYSEQLQIACTITSKLPFNVFTTSLHVGCPVLGSWVTGSNFAELARSSCVKGMRQVI